MQSVHLNASSLTIRFDIQPSGWTKVYLDASKKSTELGAEVNYILFRKIYGFLNRQEIQTLSGEIEGIPVSHLFSLSEKHTSVYASTDLREPTLFFQNSKGEIFAKMNLPSEEIKTWTEQLKRILLDLSP